LVTVTPLQLKIIYRHCNYYSLGIFALFMMVEINEGKTSEFV